MNNHDVSKSGNSRTKKHYLELISKVRELYDGHLPYSLNLDDVVHDLCPSTQANRDRDSLRSNLKECLNQEGGVFDLDETNSETRVRMIREFRELSESDAIFFPKVVRSEVETPNGRRVYSKSKICLTTLGDGSLLYVYPTILDANYREIFSMIFSANTSGNEKYKKDLKEGKWGGRGLYSIKKDTSVTVPLRTDNHYDKLRTAVRFLIEFLFAKLTSDLQEARGHKFSENKRERDKRRKKLSRLLDNFDAIGFGCPTRSSLSKVINDSLTPLEIVDFSTLESIKYAARENSITIPEFWISTQVLFELYTFSYLKEKNPDSIIAYKPVFTNDSGQTEEPDIVIYDDDRALVVDAKYKFQYKEELYCEIGDINRMLKYLFYLKDNSLPGFNKSHNGYEKPQGLFMFPSIYPSKERFASDILNDDKDYIGKINCPFPVDESTIPDIE